MRVIMLLIVAMLVGCANPALLRENAELKEKVNRMEIDLEYATNKKCVPHASPAKKQKIRYGFG